MGAGHHVARDISYASSASSKGGRAVIRVLENATGRLKLIKRAEGYDEEIAQGRDFWQVITERYGLSLDVIGGALDNIPKDGPLVLISNHPYGILDGVMMGHILSLLRGDFRILANNVFRRSETLQRYVLPISFDQTKEAQRVNLETRKSALTYLAEGGAIGVFPGGTVATARKPFATPMDPAWRTFTAKMITKSKATVVPIYFEGHNSRLFQIASHLHNTLRLALLISEFRTRVDEPVKIAIGRPIPQDLLDAYAGEPKSMMDFLRNQTYALSPKPLKSTDYGFEFEERWKT
mgnify:CR=1 FL=1